MDASVLLNLENEDSSIVKLEAYLDEHHLVDVDYLNVGLKLIDLFLTLSRKNYAFSTIEKIYDKQLEDHYKAYFLSKLVLLFLEHSYNEEALNCIDELYNLNNDVYLYHKNMVRYAEVIKSEELEIAHLLELSKCNISIQEQFSIITIVIEKYYANRDYESYLELVPRYKELCLQNGYKEEYNSGLYNEGFINFKLGNFKQAKDCFLELISKTMDTEVSLKAYNFLMRIYLEENNYKEILTIKKLKQNDFIHASEKTMQTYNDLIKETYTRLSEDELRRLIKEVDEEAQEVTLDVVLNNDEDFITHMPILENDINVDDYKLDFNEDVKYEDINFEDVFVSHQNTLSMQESFTFDNNLEFLKTLLSGNLNNKLRDIIRNLGIALEDKTKVSEFVVINTENYKGHHYKQTRVYDKIFTKDLFAKTPFSKVSIEDEIIIFKNCAKTFYNIDLLTGKVYDLVFKKAFVGIPIILGDIMQYIIGFYLIEDDINDDILYDLKRFAVILQFYIINQEDYFLKDSLSNAYLNLLDHFYSGYKIIYDDHIFVSENAQQKFNISENISLNDYNMLIIDDNFHYDTKLLQMLPDSYLKLEYSIQGCLIEDLLYKDTNHKIFSFMRDKTKDSLTINNLEQDLYKDKLTGLLNKNKLLIDLESYLGNLKFTLILVDINDYSMYLDLYGYEFASDLLSNVSRALKDATIDLCNAYYIDNGTFGLIIKDSVDKRTIVNHVLKIINYLEQNVVKLTRNVKLSFSSGIAKYSLTDKINEDKLLTFAFFALKKAKEESQVQSIIKSFSLEEYKKAYYEQGLVSFLSDAIDHNMLSINYKQTVNIRSNQVEYYKASFSLSNYVVDEKILQEVVEKRNMHFYIDTYVATKVIEQAYELYKKTGKLFKVAIDIHEKTFQNSKFLVFVEAYLKKFGIPKEALILNLMFKIDVLNREKVEILVKNGYTLMVGNIDDALEYRVKYFKHPHLHNLSDAKKQMYLVQIKSFVENYGIKFVYDDVVPEELMILKEMNVYYIAGDVYKKTSTINDFVNLFNK